MAVKMGAKILRLHAWLVLVRVVLPIYFGFGYDPTALTVISMMIKKSKTDQAEKE